MDTEGQVTVQDCDCPRVRESREDFVKLVSVRERFVDVDLRTLKAVWVRGRFKYYCVGCLTQFGGLRVGLGRQCAVCKHHTSVWCVLCCDTRYACETCGETMWNVV
eukprot:49870-Eustigmatos_ZCMA.PRE.1